MEATQVLHQVREVSAGFARDRRARQLRRELVPSDFDQLREAGFLQTAVPVDMGGIWEDPARSTRPVCEVLRVLAHGDPSVALVSAMHPAVLSFWLATPEVPEPFTRDWSEQRQAASQLAREGAWWGTITSEPGSGGDVAQTRAVARPDGPTSSYRLTGDKHFGSGSGITSYMLTSALPAGESEPDWFFLDVRGTPWDGSTGMQLLAPWDGHGMTATQSHAFRFTDFPMTRFAWPGHWREISNACGGFVGCIFTAVVVGIVEIALETARTQLVPRHDSLRPYEQVEWARAEQEGWLIVQAYEGMLRAMEHPATAAPLSVVRGKTAIAELAESTLGRICKIMGGGTFARQSAFGCWFEDVRALGFLRPPWGVAYDRLIRESWPSID